MYSNTEAIIILISSTVAGIILCLAVTDYPNTINIHKANIRAMEIDLAKYKDGKVTYLDKNVKFILTGEK